MFGARRKRRAELVTEGTEIVEKMWIAAREGEWSLAREFFVVLGNVNAEIIELGLRGEDTYGPFHSDRCSFELSISTRKVRPTSHADFLRTGSLT